MRGGAILQQPMSCVGVDVSKHHLDVAFPGTRQVWRTKNDVVGIKALAKRLAVLDRPQLVCEATGGYTRALVRGMATVTTPMSRINPRQVGDFARATGKLAKTDAIDAGIILQFARPVRNFVCGRAVEHYAAMALMKRSPKMTANWALAMDHSRGGIFHSFSDRFKIR